MAKDTDMGGTTMGTENESDKAYDRLKAKQENSGKAKDVLRGAGYARGGGVSPVRAKKIADKEVHKHEKKDHPGKKMTKLKHGGKIEGKKSHGRADKFARGGSVPKGHHTKVVVNVGASQADKQQAAAQGAKMGAQMMAQKMAGGARPGAGAPMQARSAPMAPPSPGGMPGGGPQGVPPTMGAARGGRAYKRGGGVPASAKKSGTGPKRVAGPIAHLSGSAGGGIGRREKIKQYGAKP